ncbi:signal peptidase I [Anatilimnocola floriformis]|uniref:signal peptidase I n=1 Tax=Anatilimnocola floriformis TaxID=2948575 RepID=UPI0020C24A3F|nr:signal peptidase I [Anatilimnocola floriformis]
MTTILLVIAFLIASHFIQWVAWGICLAIGLKWARTAEISGAKIARVTVVTHVIQNTMLAVMGLMAYFGGQWPPALLVIPVATIAIAMPFVPIWLVYRTFQLPVWRSIQALIPTLLVLALGYSIAAGLMKPFLWEGYPVTDNSMASTLRSKHWRGTCPECGKVTIGTPVDPVFDGVAGSVSRALMICEHNFHTSSRETSAHTPTYGPDHVAVAKYKTPQRWDLIAYRSPSDPEQVNFKRLIGLPGETIVIKGGAIWANDKQLTPPDELKHLVYLDHDPNWPHDFWGSADRPAVLGADEFFVLGDFSKNSHDSRMWHEQHGKHPAYALPRENIIGVAVLIYWPPPRWREL